MGQTDEAETYYLNSLELQEKLAEETKIIEARNILAATYNNLGAFNKDAGRSLPAWDYHQKALELTKELAVETGIIQSRENLAGSYNNLGNFSRESGKFEQSEEYYARSLEIIVVYVCWSHRISQRIL